MRVWSCHKRLGFPFALMSQTPSSTGCLEGFLSGLQDCSFEFRVPGMGFKFKGWRRIWSEKLRLCSSQLMLKGVVAWGSAHHAAICKPPDVAISLCWSVGIKILKGFWPRRAGRVGRVSAAFLAGTWHFLNKMHVIRVGSGSGSLKATALVLSIASLLLLLLLHLLLF